VPFRAPTGSHLAAGRQQGSFGPGAGGWRWGAERVRSGRWRGCGQAAGHDEIAAVSRASRVLVSRRPASVPALAHGHALLTEHLQEARRVVTQLALGQSGPEPLRARAAAFPRKRFTQLRQMHKRPIAAWSRWTRCRPRRTFLAGTPCPGRAASPAPTAPGPARPDAWPYRPPAPGQRRLMAPHEK
jgi:hypothetical protein